MPCPAPPTMLRKVRLYEGRPYVRPHQSMPAAGEGRAGEGRVSEVWESGWVRAKALRVSPKLRSPPGSR